MAPDPGTACVAATVFWRKDRAGGGPAVEVSPGTRLMVVERSSDFAGVPVVRVRDDAGREFGDVHWDWLRAGGGGGTVTTCPAD